MKGNDSEFVQEIKQLSNPETTAHKSKENREAIKYLAKEIAKLKQSHRGSTTKQKKSIQEILESIPKEEDVSKQEQEEIEEEIKAETEQVEEETEQVEEETEQVQEELEEAEEAEDAEDEEDVRKVDGSNFNGNVYKVLRNLKSHYPDWTTSTQVAEEEGITKNKVSNTYPYLKNEDLLETSKFHGIKLKEPIELKEPDEDELKTCIICEETYTTDAGVSSHARHEHGITSDDFPSGVTVASKLCKADKTEEEINRIKDNLGGVENEELDYEERDFPKYDKGEKIEEPDYWDADEREALTVQILRESDKPLTRGQIASEMYNLDYEPSFGDSYYNAIGNHIRKWVEEGIVNEAEIMGQSKAYALPGSSNDVGTLSKQEPEEKQVEGEVKISDATKRLNEHLDDSDGRREFNFLKNTFAKLIHQEEKKKINYFDFSEHYGGEQEALDAFSNLFQSPTILNGIRKEVKPESRFVWEKTAKGKNPSKWVLKVK